MKEQWKEVHNSEHSPASMEYMRKAFLDAKGFYALDNEVIKWFFESDHQYHSMAPIGIDILTSASNYQDNAPKTNKYLKSVRGITIDVYDVLKAFNVTNPATQHAIKKLLAAGNRGYKNTVQDLNEAIESILRAIELEEME